MRPLRPNDAEICLIVSNVKFTFVLEKSRWFKIHPHSQRPENCKVLITGGTKGIGKEIALSFSKRWQAHLILVGRKVSELEEAKKECLSQGASSVNFVAVDLLSGSLDGIVDACKDGIDIFVCNAGCFTETPVGRECTEQTLASMERVIKLNLQIPMLLTARITPLIIKGQEARDKAGLDRIGCLLYVNSMAAFECMGVYSAYGASKEGLLAFTKCVFKEVRTEGIKVCSIHPACVSTDLLSYLDAFDLKKMILPKEVADAALFVAEAESYCPLVFQMENQIPPVK
ncbi:Short-chain dehydrogenase/reductase SDR like protein [Aduncisulcus paluster]|uniref:Short-chain dehydrogenase/reductase SDR like protein n=1 Tax=Aduncisulcus paluster TaxID=2918883 RepID=A0ABQ5K3E0_9EUKA|nr:Short-chain dehydrogenase/reductase SDR like protein [Aduncisulcus paluster]